MAPPTISDGWGGIDDAMVEVYGVVPEYCRRGRLPTKKRAHSGWLYLQMVKQRDERGRVKGIKLRSNLTSRLFNGRQVRKTLAFSKEIEAYRAAAAWEDCYYNLVRPHKNLRLPVTDISPRK
jgi:hypothetical protein